MWDHLGSLTGSTANLDAVAMHATLAAVTERVLVGCLVYSVGYRNPAVLAGAIATIDHVSGGRAVLGLGAGYLEAEYRAAGLPFLPTAQRAASLVETTRAVRALLDGETVSTSGPTVHLQSARCAPPPAQPHLPIIIGGGGEKVTIPLAARLADGWNIPMATPETVARKVRVLRQEEERAGRLPGSVEVSVNVGLCPDPRLGPDRYGARWEALRPAVCSGSADEMCHLLAQYRQAGVDRINFSVRAPYDQAVHDDLEAVCTTVLPLLGTTR